MNIRDTLTPEEAIKQLWKMQSQIIHGSAFFGKTAQLIELLLQENKELRDAAMKGTKAENSTKSIDNLSDFIDDNTHGYHT